MVTCCTVSIYLLFVSGANILNNSSVFHRPRSRTNYFYFSYVPSVINVWNTLPVDIRLSSSVSVFKRNLLQLAHVLY